MPTYSDAQLELAARILYDRPSKFIPYHLGCWADAILLGSLLVMFISWLSNGYQIERRVTRVLIFYLVVVACGISCFLVAAQIYLFADSYGTYKNFLNPIFYRLFIIFNTISRVPAAVSLSFRPLLATADQKSWFSYRAWLMTERSIFIPISVIPLFMATIGCTIAAFVTSAPVPLPHVSRILITVLTSTGVTVDLINTFTIATCLAKARTGWKKTDSAISRSLYVTAETQLPPTLAAIGYIICFLGWPEKYELAFYWQGITKVHAVCLLAVVNSRIKIRALMGNEEAHELPEIPSGLQISVESQSSEITKKDTPTTQRHFTSVDVKGQAFTVNGRHVGQSDQRHPYREMQSETSLV